MKFMEIGNFEDWLNGAWKSMRVDSVLTMAIIHTRGQTVIDYHEEFKQAQNEW